MSFQTAKKDILRQLLLAPLLACLVFYVFYSERLGAMVVLLVDDVWKYVPFFNFEHAFFEYNKNIFMLKTLLTSLAGSLSAWKFIHSDRAINRLLGPLLFGLLFLTVGLIVTFIVSLILDDLLIFSVSVFYVIVGTIIGKIIGWVIAWIPGFRGMPEKKVNF